MIDERMNRNSIIERLPKWVLSSLADRSGKFDLSFRSISQVILFLKRHFSLTYVNRLVF